LQIDYRISTLNSKHRYKWIAFDAVGTIIHPVPPAAEVYFAAAQRFGSRLDKEEIGRRFSLAFRATEQGDLTAEAGVRLVTSEIREKERWAQIVATVIDDIPDTASCFAELFAHFARPDAWRCFDEVPSVLSGLKAAGYDLAIASNFDCRLHTVCDGIAALHMFDFRIISSEVGIRKPHSDFFESLVRSAGCRPHEMLMVGDDLSNDIEGARRAGLGAVFLNRRGLRRPGEIGNLAELPDWLTNQSIA
jgi:putative hydrolase of the HAD superfamily